MNRFAAWLLSLALILSLCACSGTQPTPTPDATPEATPEVTAPRYAGGLHPRYTRSDLSDPDPG